jgi:tetratricopeptide (TPR) repeat protein
VRLARGDAAEALLEFDHEIASGPGQLYAPEFAMNAHDGAGFVHLLTGDPADAVFRFRKALELFPDHAKSLVGLGAAMSADGDAPGAEAAFAKAVTAIDALRRGGRTGEGTLAEALNHVVRRREDAAITCLQTLLDRAEMSFTGWTIPVEPLFQDLRQKPAFQPILSRLGERAR